MDINRVQWTYISMTKALLWFSPSIFFYIAALWSVLFDPDLKMVCEFIIVISAIIINVKSCSCISVVRIVTTLRTFQIIPKMITFLWFVDEVKVLLDMVVRNTTNSYTNTLDEQRILQKYTKFSRLHLNESNLLKVLMSH